MTFPHLIAAGLGAYAGIGSIIIVFAARSGRRVRSTTHHG